MNARKKVIAEHLRRYAFDKGYSYEPQISEAQVNLYIDLVSPKDADLDDEAILDFVIKGGLRQL